MPADGRWDLTPAFKGLIHCANKLQYFLVTWLTPGFKFPLLPEAEGFLNLSGGHPEIFTGGGGGGGVGGGVAGGVDRILFHF